MGYIDSNNTNTGGGGSVDGSQYVEKSNNGSDFAIPGEVRANIGAGEAAYMVRTDMNLADISDPEAARQNLGVSPVGVADWSVVSYYTTGDFIDGNYIDIPMSSSDELYKVTFDIVFSTATNLRMFLNSTNTFSYDTAYRLLRPDFTSQGGGVNDGSYVQFNSDVGQKQVWHGEMIVHTRMDTSLKIVEYKIICGAQDISSHYQLDGYFTARSSQSAAITNLHIGDGLGNGVSHAVVRVFKDTTVQQ